MRTDAELKADLMERLDAIPAISASDIQTAIHARCSITFTDAIRNAFEQTASVVQEFRQVF